MGHAAQGRKGERVWRAASRQHALNDLRAAGDAREALLSAIGLEEQVFVPQAQRVEDGRVQIHHRQRTLDGQEADFIRGSDACAGARAAAGEPNVVRFRMPDEGSTTFTDLLRGEITVENALLDDVLPDFVARRPQRYMGVRLRDLCDEMHALYREANVSALQAAQFRAEHLPEMAMLPQAAVQELVRKQASILARSAQLPMPGGRLVYATCSLIPAENEDIAQLFAAEHPEFVQLDARAVLEQAGVSQAESLVTPAGHLRMWPHRHATDGFYAVAWEKKA